MRPQRNATVIAIAGDVAQRDLDTVHFPGDQNYAAPAKGRLWTARRTGPRLPAAPFPPAESHISRKMKLSPVRAAPPAYFENVRCESTAGPLGYLPDLAEISALEPNGTALAAPETAYKPRKNNELYVCSWMLPAASDEEFCRRFPLQPHHSGPQRPRPYRLWQRSRPPSTGCSTRCCAWGCRWRTGTTIHDHGLAFDFLADPSESHAAPGVTTGHDNGLITLALKEADDVTREKNAARWASNYRTLFGTFPAAPQSGHYFWDRLVANTDQAMLNACRALFGDDRRDCARALQKHYEEGVPQLAERI